MKEFNVIGLDRNGKLFEKKILSHNADTILNMFQRENLPVPYDIEEIETSEYPRPMSHEEHIRIHDKYCLTFRFILEEFSVTPYRTKAGFIFFEVPAKLPRPTFEQFCYFMQDVYGFRKSDGPSLINFADGSARLQSPIQFLEGDYGQNK